MTDSTARRVDKLTLARQATSRAKTAQAVAAVRRLHAAGEPITFARVARTAAVSTWFTYNNAEVTAAVRNAQADQAEHGLSETLATADRVSAASLKVDLEHARDQARGLKAQNLRLQQTISLRLGAELEAGDPAEMLGRLRALEQHNRELARKLATSTELTRRLADELTAAHDDAAAAREALRRMIRPVGPA